VSTIPSLEAVIAELVASAKDPRKKVITAQLATDAIRVATLAAVDPTAAEKEMRFVRATALNFTAAEVSVIEAKLMAWVSATIRTAIIGA
jgi:hypothetical protein